MDGFLNINGYSVALAHLAAIDWHAGPDRARIYLASGVTLEVGAQRLRGAFQLYTLLHDPRDVSQEAQTA